MTETTVVFLAGIFGSIAAYLLKAFVLEPLIGFRAVRGRVQNRLRFFSNVVTNSGLSAAMVGEARTELRQLSCDLEEAYAAIGLGRAVAGLGGMPTAQAVDEASSKLIFLSNAGGEPGRESQNGDAIVDIKKALKIP